MQTSNAKQNSRSDDPLWVFLAEYSLSEFMPEKGTGDALIAGLLSQTIRDLGIPPECLNKIKRTLIEFVQQTKVHFNQCKREFPIVIRLFYGKKLINSGNSAKPARKLQARQALEPTPMIHPVDIKIFGGWGYFIVERARGFPASSTEDSLNFIDIYLYQEGK